eukprot:Sspe_Gene.1576::Locus_521_Transcript_1_1_Confidence_1.000_Length_1317::g.1576::m.1576/K12812/UAP56, BAT1, SUB2; ATP-dependent RNA helicase UAP56/SUB2
MKDPLEIYVDSQSKLTLHGLQQYYVDLKEEEKIRKLTDLLDSLDFNQVVIFVRSKERCEKLNELLRECAFPSIAIHANLDQETRIKTYQSFKDFKSRICVATDLFGRGIDIERVNIVIQFDMAPDADSVPSPCWSCWSVRNQGAHTSSSAQSSTSSAAAPPFHLSQGHPRQRI